MKPAENLDHCREKKDLALRIAGGLWLGSGLCGFLCFAAVALKEWYISPIRLVAPAACALVAVCGYGLYRRAKWAKLLASIVAPLFILAMLDLLLMIVVKHGVGAPFYLACAMFLLGVYIMTLLLIGRTGGSDTA